MTKGRCTLYTGVGGDCVHRSIGKSVFLVLVLHIHMSETLAIKIWVTKHLACQCATYPFLSLFPPAIYSFPLLVFSFLLCLTSSFLLPGFFLSNSSTSSSPYLISISSSMPPYSVSPLCFQLTSLVTCVTNTFFCHLSAGMKPQQQDIGKSCCAVLYRTIPLIQRF